MAKAKLRELLDKQKGVDNAKTRQKKHMKEVEKKKRKREEEELDDEDEDEDDEDDEDGMMVFDEQGEIAQGFSQDEESDEEELDLARLDESDSDSEDDEATKKALERVTKALGISAASLNGEDDAESLDLEEGSDDDEEAVRNGEQDDDDDNDEEEDEEEDIPLSDLSDAESADNDIVPHQRLTINNTAALQRSLASFSLPYPSMSFSDHQTITNSAATDIPDVDDDLNRELAFYAQSLSAVKEARAKLRKEGVPFTRPADYFAEMVKSDEHMGKVKGKLVEDAASKKAAQDARRQRDLKKFGKQVQQEKLKERAKQKREMLDNVKALKKKRKDGGLDTTHEEDMFDVALEDAATTQQKDREERRAKASSQHKRKAKDAKYGFGGKKRYAKEGDSKSAADMRGFSVKKMKAGGAKQRPGKSKRAKLSR